MAAKANDKLTNYMVTNLTNGKQWATDVFAVDGPLIVSKSYHIH